MQKPSEKKTTNAQKPIAVLRPHLIVWLLLLRYLPLQFNCTVIATVFSGLFIFLHQLYTGKVDLHWQPFVYIALCCFFTFPVIILLIYKRIYRLTRYIFYANHLEYYDGFWNIERKIVKYKTITEIQLHRNILQRLHGIGSIEVQIPSITQSKKKSGIILANIKQYEKAYAFLQKKMTAVTT